MIKQWLVKCKVDMRIGTEANIIVKAITERNARSKAINELYSKGYFYTEVLSCKKIIKESRVMKCIKYIFYK